MRSLLDSYIELDGNNAVLSILKMGKRFVGLIEECLEDERRLTVFSFIKTPLEMLVSLGQTIENIDDIYKPSTGYFIFEQKTVVGKPKRVIESFLKNIDTLGYFSTVNWSSSYSISNESLTRLFAIFKQYQADSFPYNSINFRNGSNGSNNKKWFIQLLSSADLKISLPTDEGDPVMIDSSAFSFGSTQELSNTTLLEASYNGDLNQAKFAIADGADVNALVNVGLLRNTVSTLFYPKAIDGIYKYNKFSALMFAVCKNNEAIVKLLIDNKADIDLSVKINNRVFFAMDFAILFNLLPIYTGLYNLDANHYLPLSFHSKNNRLIIERLGLGEFIGCAPSPSIVPYDYVSSESKIISENFNERPDERSSDIYADSKAVDSDLNDAKVAFRLSDEQGNFDEGCDVEALKNESVDATYADAKSVVLNWGDSKTNFRLFDEQVTPDQEKGTVEIHNNELDTSNAGATAVILDSKDSMDNNDDEIKKDYVEVTLQFVG